MHVHCHCALHCMINLARSLSMNGIARFHFEWQHALEDIFGLETCNTACMPSKSEALGSLREEHPGSICQYKEDGLVSSLPHLLIVYVYASTHA